MLLSAPMCTPTLPAALRAPVSLLSSLPTMPVTPSPSSTDTSGRADPWRSVRIDSLVVAPASVAVEASAVAVVASVDPVVSVAVEALAVVVEASAVASAAVVVSVDPVVQVVLLAVLLASVVVSTRLLLQCPRTPSPTLLPLPVRRARLSTCAT